LKCNSREDFIQLSYIRNAPPEDNIVIDIYTLYMPYTSIKKGGGKKKLIHQKKRTLRTKRISRKKKRTFVKSKRTKKKTSKIRRRIK